jgi:hypothetical protein
MKNGKGSAASAALRRQTIVDIFKPDQRAWKLLSSSSPGGTGRTAAELRALRRLGSSRRQVSLRLTFKAAQ